MWPIPSKNVSDDEQCLGLRTRKLATAASWEYRRGSVSYWLTNLVSVYEHFGSRTASRNGLSSWTEVPRCIYIYIMCVCVSTEWIICCNVRQNGIKKHILLFVYLENQIFLQITCKDGCLMGCTRVQSTVCAQASGGKKNSCYPCSDYTVIMEVIRN
jgi:hypothetical protein